MFTKLPAYPLITNDPYISIWSRTDHPAESDTIHWSGPRKRLTITATSEGVEYALVGLSTGQRAELSAREVTATSTKYTFKIGMMELSVAFRAPLLLDDLRLTSIPVTYLHITARSLDGQMHKAEFKMEWHDDICHDSSTPQPLAGKNYASGNHYIAWMGGKSQPMLEQSSDHITIDWGYAYILSDTPVAFHRIRGHWALGCAKTITVGEKDAETCILLAYDDVASINYFGYIAQAFYHSCNQESFISAIKHCFDHRDEIFQRMSSFDSQLSADALAAGGEDYRTIVTAAYRQSIAAHKLIADRNGNPVFLSKENDSNGCIGTVDVSYPSIPLYLLYNPELVLAMARPVLEFARMTVWKYDFAPHDVGRYPYATGQVYGLATSYLDETCDPTGINEVYPPFYLYDGSENLYSDKGQMPVEESGNMILMLAAAIKAGGNDRLVKSNLDLLEKWVRYLEQYGADPGEQLCTDDFAGHLAHNVNLAIKAVCGLAAYAFIMEHFGETQQAAHYRECAKSMAQQILEKSRNGKGTGLTLDGSGWSLKYNAVWDVLFGFGLFDDRFFTEEIQRYLDEANEYGVPLDSRATYTKSDWQLWAAALAQSPETVARISGPMVKYLAESTPRVPFGDWYDTKSGHPIHMFARSVQGGLFMPMLCRKKG
ncbi:MAG: DUF4965 domain-containing protein [Victivallales bacterium]|nr:DUF4965 domain-containing protein [Victivallales bacterium]